MKFFDVFKAGNYPQGTFSEQDVESLASNYDPKFCEAPITLDHEQKGPAYGWVKELKSENGKLKASFRDVAPELKDYVQSGKYRKISVEIYKEIEGRKPYLKAVSFLGACIPQVKGMEPVEFKDGDTETYIFEVDDLLGSAEPEIKINEELVKPQNQVSELESQVVLFIDKPNKNEYSELVSAMQEKVQKMSTQISQMQDDSVARQKAENELTKLRYEIKTNDIEQFLLEQIDEGIISPAQKEMCTKIFMALDAGELEHSQDFKEFIKSIPKNFEFDTIASTKKQFKENNDSLKFSNASEDSIGIYKEAKKLAERDKISFKDALLKLYE